MPWIAFAHKFIPNYRFNLNYTQTNRRLILPEFVLKISGQIGHRPKTELPTHAHHHAIHSCALWEYGIDRHFPRIGCKWAFRISDRSRILTRTISFIGKTSLIPSGASPDGYFSCDWFSNSLWLIAPPSYFRGAVNIPRGRPCISTEIPDADSSESNEGPSECSVRYCCSRNAMRISI